MRNMTAVKLDELWDNREAGPEPKGKTSIPELAFKKKEYDEFEDQFAENEGQLNNFKHFEVKSPRILNRLVVREGVTIPVEIKEAKGRQAGIIKGPNQKNTLGETFKLVKEETDVKVVKNLDDAKGMDKNFGRNTVMTRLYDGAKGKGYFYKQCGNIESQRAAFNEVNSA